jgi:hypothetical protein
MLREAVAKVDNEKSRLLVQMMDKSVPTTIDETFPVTVVKKWPGVLSAYFIIKTDRHMGGILPGIGVVRGPKHITQKFAYLITGETENEIRCDLYTKADCQPLKTWTFHPEEGERFGNQPVLAGVLGEGDVLAQWFAFAPSQFSKNDLAEMHLLLPDDWQEKWRVVKQTKLLRFCG